MKSIDILYREVRGALLYSIASLLILLITEKKFKLKRIQLKYWKASPSSVTIVKCRENEFLLTFFLSLVYFYALDKRKSLK